MFGNNCELKQELVDCQEIKGTRSQEQKESYRLEGLCQPQDDRSKGHATHPCMAHIYFYSFFIVSTNNKLRSQFKIVTIFHMCMCDVSDASGERDSVTPPKVNRNLFEKILISIPDFSPFSVHFCLLSVPYFQHRQRKTQVGLWVSK